MYSLLLPGIIHLKVSLRIQKISLHVFKVNINFFMKGFVLIEKVATD